MNPKTDRRGLSIPRSTKRKLEEVLAESEYCTGSIVNGAIELYCRNESARKAVNRWIPEAINSFAPYSDGINIAVQRSAWDSLRETLLRSGVNVRHGSQKLYGNAIVLALIHETKFRSTVLGLMDRVARRA